MNNSVEYTFHNGENTTTVDRQKQIVHMYERGGWERSYSLTFGELLDNAKSWDIEIDLNSPDENIAKVATNIMLANNAASHNLDPFRYIPRTNKMTDPRDKGVVKTFETLLDKYDLVEVLAAMDEDKKQLLKNALNKND